MKKLIPKPILIFLQRLRKFKNLIGYFIDLLVNTFRDAKLYYKHSMVFKKDSFNKIESEIVLYYHALEKGFLHENIRFKFAQYRVELLINLLQRTDVIEKYKNTQIAAAYLVMCRYYEFHDKNSVDISGYYKKEVYTKFKNLSQLKADSIINHTNENYFNEVDNSFPAFSKSRKSVRTFTGENIPMNIIEKVIDLAKGAPSVCNRQPTKVYYISDKKSIDRILDIQQGLNGYYDGITQLMVVVSDRNYFYTVGERNQLYIDGGIFVMNLLYSLHYYKIGACPAHWGHNFQKDKEIQKEIGLKDSEKVICLIPIGIPVESFKTCLSMRRSSDEILKVI
jgi:nitroreductase